VIGAAAALVGAPQVQLAAEHLRHSHRRTHRFAQLSERTIGNTRHRRDDEIVIELMEADLHGAGSGPVSQGKGVIVSQSVRHASSERRCEMGRATFRRAIDAPRCNTTRGAMRRTSFGR